MIALDAFEATRTSVGNLRVDGSDLAVMNRYLTELAQMTRVIQRTVNEADRSAQMQGNTGMNRYGSLGSAEIGGVPDISARLSSTAQAMDKNLADFAKALENTAEALTKIASQYQTVDQRNALDVAQVRKYLQS